MGGTELKTDAWHRYMLYRREDYTRSLMASDEERRAIEAGQKYTLAAYPKVWAQNVALVKRVRTFLGANFHWHGRLAKTGSDLEVVQTLHNMVRSGNSAVVVIPKKPVYSGGIASPPKAAQPLSLLPGDAQPFEYTPAALSGEVGAGRRMPFNGAPGSWASSMPGTMPQFRQYGPGGTPMTDIDFEAHHGNSQPARTQLRVAIAAMMVVTWIFR